MTRTRGMDNPTVKKNDLARLDITGGIKRRLKKIDVKQLYSVNSFTIIIIIIGMYIVFILLLTYFYIFIFLSVFVFLFSLFLFVAISVKKRDLQYCNELSVLDHKGYLLTYLLLGGLALFLT